MRIRQPRVFRTLAVVLLTFAGDSLNGQQANRQSLFVDSDASQVTIHVGKAGLFGFVGHPHEVVARGISGVVIFDPDDPASSSVNLEIEVASFLVTGKDEPVEDVPEVQRVMLSDRVLDVAQFPTITFESRTVAFVEAGGETLVMNIAGELTLHGVTRPLIVRVGIEPLPDGLSVRGEFKIKQTDFGIDPVGAAAGLVKTKNELEVGFSLRARPARTVGLDQGLPCGPQRTDPFVQR